MKLKIRPTEDENLIEFMNQYVRRMLDRRDCSQVIHLYPDQYRRFKKLYPDSGDCFRGFHVKPYDAS